MGDRWAFASPRPQSLLNRVRQRKAPRPVGRGAWEYGPPRVRGGKMRQVEVNQFRRRRPIRPAAPSSAIAPGAGTVKDINWPVEWFPDVRKLPKDMT